MTEGNTSMYSGGPWTLDDLPSYNWWDDDQPYQDRQEIEDDIVETFDSYEESGLDLDLENMVEIAITWRDLAVWNLEEKGELSREEMSKAYKRATSEFRDDYDVDF